MNKENDGIDYKLYITFEIKVPQNWRESALNTIVQDLRTLNDIEKNNGYWDIDNQTNLINETIDNMILQLRTLKIKEK